MPKTVEEVLGSLPEEDRGVVGAAIDAVKADGSKKYSEARGEVTRLLDKYKPLEKAFQEAGIDPANAENLIDSLKGVKEATAKAGKTSELERTVAQLQKDREADRAELAATRERVRLKTLSEMLNIAIGDDLIDGTKQYIIPQLITAGVAVLDADGETLTFKINGEQLDANAGIEAWKKANKACLKSNQAGGSGTSGGTTGPRKSGDGKLHVSQREYDAMSAKDKSRFLVYADGKSTGNVIDPN
jgi:hypothetical protein